MAQTVTFHGSREQIIKALSALPLALAGKGDPYNVAQSVQITGANELLAQIQQDFIIKSRGGVGSDGVQWPPLTKETIAGRGINKGDLAAIGVKGAKIPKNRVRGLLTADQDRRWRGIFASTLAKARMHMSESEAMAYAGKTAWAILKSQGAQTKLEVLGNRVVDIGRDTDKMFKSFTPGVEDRPSGAEDQILKTPPGELIVGTNVPYAPKFADKRPFWPKGGQLPAPWAAEILLALNGAIVKAVVVIAMKGPI